MPIDRAQQALVQKVLGEPENFPDKFKTWVQKFVGQSPLLTITAPQLQGFIPGGKLQLNVGAAPPSNPGNYELWLLPVDPTNGVNWLFIYNAASSSGSKWEAIAPVPLFAEVTATDTVASAAYAAMANAGPSIALPRAGDYDVEIGAHCQTTSGTGSASKMSYDIGGTGAVDADCLFWQQNSTGQILSGSRLRRKTGLTAVTLTSKYSSSDNLKTSAFERRWMKVTPVRVS